MHRNAGMKASSQPLPRAGPETASSVSSEALVVLPGVIRYRPDPLTIMPTEHTHCLRQRHACHPPPNGEQRHIYTMLEDTDGKGVNFEASGV